VVTIISKRVRPKGRTRTSVDKELVDAGWGSTFKSEDAADKCAYLERRLKEEYNMDDSRVIAPLINRVK
jgi:hypothetical protein